MDKILQVHSVNEYARYVGAPVLHPLVSVIHYDELERCRHALRDYGVYVLFFHPDILAGTLLERCFAAIRKELEEFPEDNQAILISYLSLLLELAELSALSTRRTSPACSKKNSA